jgi:hypothetical protein
MSKNYKIIKTIIIGVSTILIILLIIFTIDIINEEPKWAWFDIDFNNSKVSNYGTLIGGLLSFLAIMFVIFGFAEQREQVNEEKFEKAKEVIDEYSSRLKLMNSLLNNILAEIKLQGDRMEKFFKIEKEQPTQSNATHFSANKSFNRILEMDSLMNYKSIQHYFKDEDGWEKMFLNLYNFVDFYSASLEEHLIKYQNHILDKVERQKEVSEMCRNFLNKGTRLLERYRIEFGNDKYLTKNWAIAYNDFIPAYYHYINECIEKKEQTNFRFLSDNFFFNFIKIAMEIRADEGFDEYESEDLVEIASAIRKKISEIEMYSIQYAENIEYYFNEYFSSQCNFYKDFEYIKKIIEEKVTSIK